MNKQSPKHAENASVENYILLEECLHYSCVGAFPTGTLSLVVQEQSNGVTSRVEPVHEADPSVRVWLMCDVAFSEVCGIRKDCKFWSSSRS